MGLQLKRAAPAQGVQWVRMGLRTFGRRAVAFTGFLSLFLLSALVLLMLSWPGLAVTLAALPLLSLGYMNATRAALKGERPTLAHFTAPLRTPGPRRTALLKLCALYGIAMLLVLIVSEWVDGGRLDRVRELMTSESAQPQDLEALLDDGRLIAAVWLRLGLTALLSIPFWHAPPLVAWGGQGVAQSLFSSTVACWRNKGAFTLYALAGLGLVMAVAVGSSILFSLLGLTVVLGPVAVAASLLFSAAFYVSLYFSFVDCFGTGEPAAQD
jgi:hypothetical protein